MSTVRTRRSRTSAPADEHKASVTEAPRNWTPCSAAPQSKAPTSDHPALKRSDAQVAVERFRAIVASTELAQAPHTAPAPRDGVLYTLTTLSAHGGVYGGRSTVAIYRNWNRAARAIRENHGDLWETTYHLAVIEEVEADKLYGGCGHRAQWWFRYDGDERTGRYIDIERPEAYARVTGVGIG